MVLTPKVEARLNELVEVVDANRLAYYQTQYPNIVEMGGVPTLAIQVLQTRVRLVNVERGTVQSVYAFVDMEGNIYKPAGFKVPAKHIRGSIFDENCSWDKALGVYGVAYLR